MARQRKNFYAIAQGNCPPIVSQCWASVHACVNGWSGNRYKGFATFEEAKFYLEAAGHTTFHFDQGPGDGPKPRSSLEAYYSVARGRQTGIQQTYGDTRVLVEKSSGACHKSFATKEMAVAFLEAGLAALQPHTASSYQDER